ncbi:HNH endonuclease [Ralstonia nicotianae]
MADADGSTRVCSACKFELPVEQFNLRRKGGLSRHTQCKECCKKKLKVWQQENRQRKREKWLEWVRANPEKFAATQKRYRTKHANRVHAYNVAYAAANREEIARRSRISYQTRKEKHKLAVYEWRRCNPEAYRSVGANYRARKRAANGSHTGEDIKRLYELQRGCCAYCAKRLGKKYDVDHIVPLALGGANGKENLQILCPSCNRKKQAADPIDYANRIGKLI